MPKAPEEDQVRHGLDAKALQEVIVDYKKAVKKHAKRDFPQDAIEQW